MENTNSSAQAMAYRQDGYCPICEAETQFASKFDWYRDHLFCGACKSIPRERAVALMLDRYSPAWREKAIHESSPAPRGISRKLREQCKHYISTQFFQGSPLGSVVRGFRNENLEAQTFTDECFDLVISLDVMEHVNKPDRCFAEIARTLKPGGMTIFTAPTYKTKIKTERRAEYMGDGSVQLLVEPAEYHGNPISAEGALVTFHYGYDFPELIYAWSGLQVEMSRFHDHRLGLIGEFTEVYIASKV